MLMKTSIRTNVDAKEIFLADTTDQNNLPCAYNTKTRRIKKAIAYVEENRARLEQMTMYQVIYDIHFHFNCGFHSYCAMD